MTEQTSDSKPPDWDLLKALHWHVNRADVQRATSWSRAGSVLSANALVVAGAAVLVRSSSQTNLAAIGVALLPFIAALLSAYEASTVIAGPWNFEKRLTTPESPPSMLYAMRNTTSMVEGSEQFESILRSRSYVDETDGAIRELWRMGILSEARSRHLHRATLWFILAISLLALSVILEFALIGLE